MCLTTMIFVKDEQKVENLSPVMPLVMTYCEINYIDTPLGDVGPFC